MGYKKTSYTLTMLHDIHSIVIKKINKCLRYILHIYIYVCIIYPNHFVISVVTIECILFNAVNVCFYISMYIYTYVYKNVCFYSAIPPKSS